MIHQNKSTSMDIHHAKGFQDPSTYSRYIGGITIVTNFWTPCTSSFGLPLSPPQCGRHIWMPPKENEGRDLIRGFIDRCARTWLVYLRVCSMSIVANNQHPWEHRRHRGHGWKHQGQSPWQLHGVSWHKCGERPSGVLHRAGGKKDSDRGGSQPLPCLGHQGTATLWELLTEMKGDDKFLFSFYRV